MAANLNIANRYDVDQRIIGQQELLGSMVGSDMNAAMLQMKKLARDILKDDIAEYQNIIHERDNKIDELKEQIRVLKLSKTSSASYSFTSSITTDTYTPKHEYTCNKSLFPKQNYAIIIEVLQDLCSMKRERGKYIIKKKTDWYMAWKVLHLFKVYIGTESEFVDLVHECVIPYIDESRREELDLTYNNFKSILKDNPIKAVAVVNWRKTVKQDRENKPPKPFQNEHALERGINILVNLQEMLTKQGVKIENAEK